MLELYTLVFMDAVRPQCITCMHFSWSSQDFCHYIIILSDGGLFFHLRINMFLSIGRSYNIQEYIYLLQVVLNGMYF